LKENPCWQYLKKIEIANKFKEDIPYLSNCVPTIYEIEYHLAKQFILKYEWVGNMGTSKHSYGLFLDDNLVSVVCYGPLIAPTLYKNIFSQKYSHSLYQLCRGASSFLAPKWAPSKLISRSMKLISKKLGTKIIVAYADPSAGEIGTIYKACNAIYLGYTSPGGGKKYKINGHLYDPRKVHAKFGSRSHEHLIKIDPNYTTIPILPKHRYVFLTGSKIEKKEIFNKIKYLIRPFPKRAQTLL